MTTEPAADLTTLLPDLITDSPAIRARIEARLLEFIDEMFDTLTDEMLTGDRATRSTIMKQLLPTILKIRRDSDEADTVDIEAMKEETRAMIFGMGENLPNGPELDDTTPDIVHVEEQAHPTHAERAAQ